MVDSAWGLARQVTFEHTGQRLRKVNGFQGAPGTAFLSSKGKLRLPMQGGYGMEGMKRNGGSSSPHLWLGLRSC